MLLCIFVTLTTALKIPSMLLRIVLLLCVQIGCRQSSVYAGIGKLILFVFFLVLPLLRKNNNSILLQRTITICAVLNILLPRLEKAMTAVLRHGTKWKNIADSKGAIPLVNLLDDINYNANPLTHHAAGRIFAAMINGNDKQRFFVDIYMYDTWFPEEFNMPWDIYIGCHQGHSNLTVTPSEVNHLLTEVECYSMGWIFHVTDKKFENSIYSDGLKRRGRDAMHFMYENNGKSGYVIKGAGTRKPREFETTIYCVLNVRSLLHDGYDLFLSANGVVLIYDDVSLEYIRIVEQYPYLGLCVFSPGTPHSLPREVQYGKWRDGLTLRRKYAEYLSADEISKYLDAKGELVEWHMPRDVGSKRRQNAWEFMGQAPPAPYMECINSLFSWESFHNMLRKERLKHQQAQHQLRELM